MAGLSFLPCGSDLGARDDRPRRVLHRPSNRAAGLTESRRERDEHCENQKGDPANQRHLLSFENLFFCASRAENLVLARVEPSELCQHGTTVSESDLSILT